ncbi:MAG: WS/DGAT domain-containing protein, partial [Acidobacteriota bacterium]
ELFARGVLNVPSRTLNSLKDLPKILPKLDDVPQLRGTPGLAFVGRIADRAHIAETRGRDGHVLERPSARAPRSVLNGTISAQRRFSFGSLSLDTVKKIKNVYGTSVNDVIVSLSTAALRDFLLERDELPDEPLVAMIPLSIRTEDQTGAFGNWVSAMIAPIPTDEPDPVERLRICHGELSRAKDYYGAMDADMLTDALNFIPPALYARTARSTTALAASPNFQPHYNVTISNIPGSPVPLYVSGALVERHYPVSVITDGMQVNITVFSYRGKLDFGIVGDPELAQSYDSMIESLRSELDALERWADAEQVATDAESAAGAGAKARDKAKPGAKSKPGARQSSSA